MNAGQSTLLFVDLFQLSIQCTNKKHRGVWEARELEFESEPAPVQKKTTRMEDRKSEKTTGRAKPELAIPAKNGEVWSKRESGEQNDIDRDQTHEEAVLVLGAVELPIGTPQKEWHSRTAEKAQPGESQFHRQNEPTTQSKHPDLKMPINTGLKQRGEHAQSSKGEALPFGGAEKSATRVTLTAAENLKNEDYGQNCYRYPRVFVLLSQIAYLVEVRRKHKELCEGAVANQIESPEEDGLIGVGTDHLLSRAREGSDEIRRALYRNLQVANELQLVNRKDVFIGGRSVTTWELTSEGKLFLLAGIKIRNAMRKVAQYSDEEICSFVSNDEIDDWKLDAQDREDKIKMHFGVGKKRFKSERPEVSRTELALVIEQQAVLKIQNSAINSLWSGLVR